MLAGKAVLHSEYMSVTMGMNAWRKWFDESACVKRLAGFLNRNNRSKKTMKDDVPKELDKQNQKHNSNKIKQNSSLENDISRMKGLEANLKTKLKLFSTISCRH